jgi:Na+-transporting methylmalonyl-CoA/oxaloacetate decarboxylase gamma subunit
MPTVVVQGGWRMWALLIVGGVTLLVLGLTVGLIMLGVLAVAGVLLLGQRALQAIGLDRRRTQAEATAVPADSIIDGEYRVMSCSTTVTSNQLADPDR